MPSTWRHLLWLAVLPACAHKPPADYAPDPGLLARVRQLRMRSTPGPICPGERIQATYEAVLDDGSVIPFATSYDEDRPPPLHVLFLRRTSPEAAPREDGGWDTYPDPVPSVSTGYRLSAFLRDKPEVNTFRTVEPGYACLPHDFRFVGEPGRRDGEAGSGGPDVVVRLDIVSSPFVDRLLVAEVAVESAPPFYVMADADRITPADWLVVESAGGAGARGARGTKGQKGAKGEAGCPGGRGGAGGAGGNGGPGGRGGRGGEVAVVVPDDQPLLAGLVEAHMPGGGGGPGGRPGEGGEGGDGGDPRGDARRCAGGEAGPSGGAGSAGRDGQNGRPGPPVQVVTVPRDQVFGPHVPPQLGELLSGQ